MSTPLTRRDHSTAPSRMIEKWPSRIALLEQLVADLQPHLLALGQEAVDRRRGRRRRTGRSRRGRRSSGGRGQVLVDEADGHRPLADGRGDALHRLAAHVACDEDAGQAGLQQVGRRGRAASAGGRPRAAARSRPARSPAVAGHRVGSQSVCGRAPMNTNIAARSISSSSPLRVSRTVIRSRFSSPWASATSLYRRTSMLSVRVDGVDQVAGHALAEVAPRHRMVTCWA